MEKYKVFAKIQDGVSLNEFKDFSDDKDVVMVAVAKKPHNLRFASDRLKDDEDVVLLAISKDGMCIQYASPRLKMKKDIAIISIDNVEPIHYFGKCMTPLEYLPEEICDDKDVVIEAVKQSYMALKFASDRLKDDDEVVEIARSNFKKQLVYASERFQYNPKYIYFWLATELKNINCSHDLVNIITKALTELAELKGWSKNEEEGKKLLKKLEK